MEKVDRGSRMIRNTPRAISQTGLALTSQVMRWANEIRRAYIGWPLGGERSRHAARN